MQKNTRVVERVVLAPGEYRIRKLIFGLNLIVATKGQLAGQTLPIWDAYANTISYSGQVPLTLIFVESRSWRTLWRWKMSINVSDGVHTVPIAMQAPLYAPITIVQQGKSWR